MAINPITQERFIELAGEVQRSGLGGKRPVAAKCDVAGLSKSQQRGQGVGAAGQRRVKVKTAQPCQACGVAAIG